MRQAFFFLNILNLCIFLNSSLSNSSLEFENSKGHIINDTSFLLSGKSGKYWDRIDKHDLANNHSGEKYNWLFTKENLYEYIYKGKRRVVPIYQNDLIIDHWTYKLSEDTLVLNGSFQTKYLIKKLTKDSLVIQHFGEFGLKRPILYLRSKDQKTKIN